MPCLAALALALALQGPPEQRGPSPDEIRAAVAALQVAFESAKPAERVVAIRENARVDAPQVVALVSKALEDRAGDVRLEAIDALGRSRTVMAFENLVAHYRDHRKELRTQERVLPRLLAAIARHGDERAVAILTDDVQAQMRQPTLRARMLGLANVRSKKSVDALVGLLTTIGFVEMHNHTEDFRLAMLVLTGVDKGRSFDAWRAWWAEARETFVVPGETPALAPSDAQRWAEFWGLPYEPEPARGR